jgi:hypothetical protein
MTELHLKIKEAYKQTKEQQIKDKRLVAQMFHCLDEDPFLQIRLIITARNNKINNRDKQKFIFGYCDRYCSNYMKRYRLNIAQQRRN